MSLRSAIVIPARYGSSRFPGKVLADLGGKSILRRVHERAIGSIADKVYVATDDTRIRSEAESFGASVVMTSPDHPSGTDRVWEVVKEIQADVVVNVQGDEPFIPTDVINDLVSLLSTDEKAQMATVAVPVPRCEVENNPNIVKVVFDNANNALYFSRSIIPFLREGGDDTPVHKHWGVYAFKRSTLKRFVSLPGGRFENCEKLEQLRALENGIGIKVLVHPVDTIGIDTPEDLEMARNKLAEFEV